MVSFQHILVPTSFNAPSRAALDTALAIAERFASQLTVLHVVEPPAPEYDEAAKIMAAADATARVRLSEWTAGARAHAICRRGEPWREILQAVHELQVDLVVLSTHGHEGLARGLISGTTDKVVRLCPARVLTVHGITTLA